MEIIVKKSQQRVDPKHPESTDPSWHKAYEKGQDIIRKGQLKFRDRGEEERYWKAVSANPGNVPGLPPFAPPLRIKPQVVEFFHETSRLERIQWLQNSTYNDANLFCVVCDETTLHSIGRKQSFCKKCGTQKTYRSQ